MAFLTVLSSNWIFKLHHFLVSNNCLLSPAEEKWRSLGKHSGTVTELSKIIDTGLGPVGEVWRNGRFMK